MNRLVEFGAEVSVGLVLLGAGALLALWRSKTQRATVAEAATLAAAQQRAETFDQIEQLFMGTPANRLTGTEAEPGLVSQIHDLRQRQEEIATTAEQAVENAKAIRLELTRNGGESTKDAAFQAARSAEAAAAAAQIAARSAERTEGLLHRHMENGLDIMGVGQHNDSIDQHNQVRVVETLEQSGISVTGLRDDYRNYPPVDIGDND